jgi:anti-sigma factor RsiW
MMDDEFLKLSAYADGELPASERANIESRLRSDPAFARALTIMKSLHMAAQNETIPQPDFDADAARLQTLAATETIPAVSNERYATVWKEITLHTSARNEAAPKIKSDRWKGVWSGISTRTAKAPDAAPIHKPARVIEKPSPFSRAWIWAAGVGLAASILLALWLPNETPQMSPINPSDSVALSAISMSIPEAQDDHYGVRVRFVSGSSDPVVSLYYKTPARANGLMGGDLDDR